MRWFIIILLTVSLSTCSGSAPLNRNGNTCGSPSGKLRGRKIVVTAPSGYSRRLAGLIEKAGGKPVILPTIETVINPESSGIDRILDHPRRYDLVVFSSRKAIQAFFQRFRERRLPDSILHRFRFSAIGKDIDYLRENSGRDAAVDPAEPSPSGIVDALREIEGAEEWSVAVIAPRVTGLTEPDVIPRFMENLEELGISADKIEGYITRPAPAGEYKRELNLIKNRRVDIIAFTSATEIEALKLLLGGTRWLNRNTVACFGPYTAANARGMGVEVDFTGKDFHSFEGYVDGIAEFLRRH